MFDKVCVEVDPYLVIWSAELLSYVGGLTPSARLQEPPNSTKSTHIDAQACSLSVQFIQRVLRVQRFKHRPLERSKEDC